MDQSTTNQAGTLSWVKAELDKILSTAREALERYTEEPDEDYLREAANALRQVEGTLELVQLYGAAVLAREMGALLQAFAEDRVRDRDEAMAVLLRAIFQLPDYLDFVEAGNQDVPIVLLPLLNDLRTVQGMDPLSEKLLFFPNLDTARVPAARLRRQADQGVESPMLARRLRPVYEVGLLGWFRGESPQKNLLRLYAVLERLYSVSESYVARRFWWVASAFVDAIASGGLDRDVTVNALLGRIDRSIKALIDRGEEVLGSQEHEQLLKNLLYYIARSSAGGPVVREVRESFALDRLLPPEHELQRLRDRVTGPGAKVFEAAAKAVLDDLTDVKDQFELYLAGTDDGPGTLEGIAFRLGEIASTLGMLGLNSARAKVEQEIALIRGMLASDNPKASESAILDMAGLMLNVEAALDDLRRFGGESASDAGGPGMTGRDWQALRSRLIDEALRDMAQLKEAVLAWMAAPGRAEEMERAPALLKQIKQALSVARVESVGPLLDAIAAYLSARFIEADEPPPPEELEGLADAVVAAEYYLESLGRDGRDLEQILQTGELRMAELGFEPGVVAPPEAREGAAVGSEERPSAVVVPLKRPEQPKDAAAGAHPPRDAAAAEEEEAAPEPAAGEPRAAQGGPLPEWLSEARRAHTDYAAISSEADEEILEIFLEEAAEELERIRSLLPRWRENPQDHEALSTIRRSFHTLKGSGRMVGALRIGEFAWAVENLLNRVLDASVESCDAVFDLVEYATELIPRLIDEVQRGTNVQDDLASVIAFAHALAKPELHGEAEALGLGAVVAAGAKESGPARAEPQAVEPSRDEAPVLRPVEVETPDAGEAGVEEAGVEEAGAESGSEPSVAPAAESDTTTAPLEVVQPEMAGTETAPRFDKELLEIFAAEAAEHAERLSRAVEASLRRHANPPITEELRRAVHTLNGSSSTAGVEAIAALCGPLERYLRERAREHRTIPYALAGTMAEVAGMIREIIDRLPEYVVPVSAVEALRVRLESAIESASRPAAPSIAGTPVPAAAGPAQRETSGSPAAAPDMEQAPEQPGEQDRELVEIFLEEATDILDSCERLVEQWSERPTDASLIEALQRQLHTLKGGARMAGYPRTIGALSHALESLIVQVVEGERAAGPDLFDVLNRSLDRLLAMVHHAEKGEPVYPPTDLLGVAKELRGEVQEQTEAETATAVPEAQPVHETAAAAAPVSVQQELVRVRAQLLDELVNHAGEVNIYHARLEQQISSFGFGLQELEQTVARLRSQLRKLEIETEAQILSHWEADREKGRFEDFDPLELDRYSTLQQLSRALSESVNDLMSIKDMLLDGVRESETLLIQQARVSTDLQDGLMRTRMVQFTSLAPRLRRVARQTAEALGKRVELKVRGETQELDRSVLDRMVAPLEHMLRNAVSHGIESPQAREAAGKPPVGHVTVVVERDGPEVVIQVADDGRGIDLDAVRRKAVAVGLLEEGQDLPDEEVMHFILESGFSTAENVSHISGRGVGMDVVASEIKQLGGTLSIDSVQGRGTSFTIRLPFTLAISQALLVEVGEELYAIPLASIEGIVRLGSEELDALYRDPRPTYQYAGHEYELKHLGTLLGTGQPTPDHTSTVYPIVLVRAGELRAALQVERVLGNREIVVKPVGPQISKVRGISGATILGDGRVILILDIAGLIRARSGVRLVYSAAEDQARASERTGPPLIMVVDDSITIRKVTSRMLERNDFEVVTARDGVDALGKLQETRPDLMLLDIEMPRMDGYELASHVRNNPRLRDLPIIMITSRVGKKHRDRAMELGVNRYLGKPYQDAELLASIHELLDGAERVRSGFEA